MGVFLPSTRFILANLSVVNIFATILLLRRFKLGFYIIVISTFMTAILNMFSGMGSISIVGGILSMAILYAILRLKKNGVQAMKILKKTDHKRLQTLYIVFALIFCSSIVCSIVTSSEEVNQYSANDNDDNLRTVTADDGSFSIDIPAMLTSSNQSGFDIYYRNQDASFEVGVLKEYKNDVKSLSLYNLSSYANYVQKNITGMTFAPSTTVQINNLSAIYYKMNDNTYCGSKAFVETNKFYYQIIVVAPCGNEADIQAKQIIYSFRVN
jgi:hypothetical protein